jgi:hypothetical protein
MNMASLGEARFPSPIGHIVSDQEAQLDDILKPEHMTHPRNLTSRV